MSKSKFKQIIGGLQDLRNWKQIIKENEEALQCRGKSCTFHENRMNRTLVNH